MEIVPTVAAYSIRTLTANGIVTSVDRQAKGGGDMKQTTIKDELRKRLIQVRTESYNEGFRDGYYFGLLEEKRDRKDKRSAGSAKKR